MNWVAPLLISLAHNPYIALPMHQPRIMTVLLPAAGHGLITCDLLLATCYLLTVTWFSVKGGYLE